MYHGNNSVTKNRKSTSTGCALTAVALQDHLVKSMALSDMLSSGNRVGANIPHGGNRRKHIVKSVTDTGRGRVTQKSKPDQSTVPREFVLDAKPPAPTLAQKLGLFEAPRQLLSEEEWTTVKEKSNRRGDSNEPCVICRENFSTTEQQVLLSCTHVFHRACLKAFEHFSGKKTCPMCRKEQYQTRVVYEGARIHRHACAARIQAYWRGYVVRCWYRKLRETNPPKDPRLRKKFFEEKLATITDRMLRSLDTNIGDLFREIDNNVEASRRVFAQMDLCTRTIDDQQWMQIEYKALCRKELDCPICLTALTKTHVAKPEVINNKPAIRKRIVGQGRVKDGGPEVERQTVLLSCTHLFHRTCLETFEELSVHVEGHVTTCPVCRSAYQKRTIPLKNL